MKQLKVTITKNVVLQKTSIVGFPDNYSEEQIINSAIEKIYQNGKEWEQIKVNSVNVATEEVI